VSSRILRNALEDGVRTNSLMLSFKSYPDNETISPEACKWFYLHYSEYLDLHNTDKAAIDELSPGDAVIIFTPDPSHYPIAMYALERKIHVLVTKPATQLLEHHQELIETAEKNGLVCWVEHHKRVRQFVPIPRPTLTMIIVRSCVL
jgi:D-galacturonate reductase